MLTSTSLFAFMACMGKLYHYQIILMTLFCVFKTNLTCQMCNSTSSLLTRSLSVIMYLNHEETCKGVIGVTEWAVCTQPSSHLKCQKYQRGHEPEPKHKWFGSTSEEHMTLMQY